MSSQQQQQPQQQTDKKMEPLPKRVKRSPQIAASSSATPPTSFWAVPSSSSSAATPLTSFWPDAEFELKTNNPAFFRQVFTPAQEKYIAKEVIDITSKEKESASSSSATGTQKDISKEEEEKEKKNEEQEEEEEKMKKKKNEEDEEKAFKSVMNKINPKFTPIRNLPVNKIIILISFESVNFATGRKIYVTTDDYLNIVLPSRFDSRFDQNALNILNKKEMCMIYKGMRKTPGGKNFFHDIDIFPK